MSLKSEEKSGSIKPLVLTSCKKGLQFRVAGAGARLTCKFDREGRQ